MAGGGTEWPVDSLSGERGSSWLDSLRSDRESRMPGGLGMRGQAGTLASIQRSGRRAGTEIYGRVGPLRTKRLSRPLRAKQWSGRPDPGRRKRPGSEAGLRGVGILGGPAWRFGPGPACCAPESWWPVGCGRRNLQPYPHGFLLGWPKLPPGRSSHCWSICSEDSCPGCGLSGF